MIKFGDPNVGEEELHLIRKIFDSKVFVHGEFTAEFERKFGAQFGYGHSISVANCTAGLHLAHYSLTKGLDKQSSRKFEVICPAMTHVATAHAIELSGLKPIFVDCNSVDANINVDLIESLITEKTVGIAAMHFNGVPCDIRKIMDIASKYGLYVVEDCAIALGAKVGGRPVGTFGNAGAFSFHPVKQITTGEGGMVCVNDSSFGAELRLERAFGVDRNFKERSRDGVYDVPLLGFNYRMAEIPAAMGVAQLDKFQALEIARQRNFRHLKQGIDGISGLEVVGGEDTSGRSYYCLIARVNCASSDRDWLAKELKNREIQTSVYYPHPVPRLNFYGRKYELDMEYFKNAITIADQTIAFSIGAHLNIDDMDRVLLNLKELI